MFRSGLAVTLLFALTCAASAQTLDAAQIESLIGDKRVLLRTPFGLELPLRYASDGTVAGDISGFSFAALFTPRETGRWWTDGGQMCQQFPTWYDAAIFCFTLEQTGEAAISWLRSDGLSGTARIEG